MAEKKAIDGKEVINGSWGEIWLDNEYMAQVIAFKAEVSVKTSPVPRAQRLQPGQKMTGFELKGEVKFHKTNSYVTKIISEKLKKGKIPVFKITSNINDPDSAGSERIVVYGATFDKLILADWELEKFGEESYSFTFTDWDIIDTIK